VYADQTNFLISQTNPKNQMKISENPLLRPWCYFTQSDPPKRRFTRETLDLTSRRPVEKKLSVKPVLSHLINWWVFFDITTLRTNYYQDNKKFRLFGLIGAHWMYWSDDPKLVSQTILWY